MTALPALTAIANAAVRRQFAPDEPPRDPAPMSPSRTRLALAAALRRAADAVAPVTYRPAH